jgi:hypothetical protein
MAAPVYTTDKTKAYQYWTEDGKLWGESSLNVGGDYNQAYHLNLATNLHNLRLTMRWPVFEQGTAWGVGRNHRTLRSLINGQTQWTLQDRSENRTNYNLAHPNTYQYVGLDALNQ